MNDKQVNPRSRPVQPCCPSCTTNIATNNVYFEVLYTVSLYRYIVQSRHWRAQQAVLPMCVVVTTPPNPSSANIIIMQIIFECKQTSVLHITFIHHYYRLCNALQQYSSPARSQEPPKQISLTLNSSATTFSMT